MVQEEEEEIHQGGPEISDLLLPLVAHLIQWLLFLFLILILSIFLLPDLIPAGIRSTPLSEMAEYEWILRESGR